MITLRFPAQTTTDQTKISFYGTLKDKNLLFIVSDASTKKPYEYTFTDPTKENVKWKKLSSISMISLKTAAEGSKFYIREAGTEFNAKKATINKLPSSYLTYTIGKESVEPVTE